MLLNNTLGENRENVFNELLARFVSDVEDSSLALGTILTIARIFSNYVSAERTKAFCTIYEKVGHEHILEIMSSGAEASALPYIVGVFKTRKYNDLQRILNALSNYSENDVGDLLVDFIEASEKIDFKRWALSALSAVLSHSQDEPQPVTLEFLKEMLRSQIYTSAAHALAGSKSDKVTVILLGEIENSDDNKRKKELVRYLANRNFDVVVDLLTNYVYDQSLRDETRSVALWTLASYKDKRVQDIVYKIATSKKVKWQLRRNAFRILLQDDYPSIMKAHIKLIGSFRSWGDLLEWHRWVGAFGYFAEKDLLEKERRDLDGCLATLYRTWISTEPVNERFDFVHTLRKWTSSFLVETFRAASNDPNIYVREEAQYALQECGNADR